MSTVGNSRRVHLKKYTSLVVGCGCTPLQAFCTLVETLLESHLAEIGVSPEDFFEICLKAKNSGSANRNVVEQILAVEDFLSALHVHRGHRVAVLWPVERS